MRTARKLPYSIPAARSVFCIVYIPVKTYTSGSTFAPFNYRNVRFGVAGLSRASLNVLKSKLAHETVCSSRKLMCSYYFHPMKVPALKIHEARGGPRREMSIEAWQQYYWQAESAKFTAVVARITVTLHLRAFAILSQLFAATSTVAFCRAFRQNFHNFAKRGMIAIRRRECNQLYHFSFKCILTRNVINF